MNEEIIPGEIEEIKEGSVQWADLVRELKERAPEPLPPVFQDAFDGMRNAALSLPARMAQGVKWEGEDGRGAMFGSSEYLNRMLWANLGEKTPEEVKAARARADARDLADMELKARLEAAPKLWCIQEDYYEGVYVLAIFPTEEAAKAALPLFAHKSGIEIDSIPFFAGA